MNRQRHCKERFGIAVVRREAVKRKHILMMNRKQIVDHIDVAVDFLQNVRHACVHDDDFPLSVDLEAIVHAKNRITEVEVLLTAETQTTVKKPEA